MTETTRLRPRLCIAPILFVFVLLNLAGYAAAADISLQWTAPGENGALGTVQGYDLRYSANPIGSDTASWWAGATQVPGEPAPVPAGSGQSMVVHGLVPGATLTFVLRAFDEASNQSPFSNVLRATVPDTSSVPTVAIENVSVDSVGDGSALVSWETVPGAFGFVRYGPTAAYGRATAAEADTSRSHAHRLTALGAGTVVHYQVVSFVDGARDSTADATFAVPDTVPTPPSDAAPARPLGLTAEAGEERVDLSWTAGAETDLAGYRAYWSAHARDDSTSFLNETFEGTAAGSDPSGWVEEGGASTNAFTVANIAGRGRVYRGSSAGYDERVRYLPSPTPVWGDLEVSGAVRADAGAGAFFILRAISSAKGYRFGFDPSGLFHIDAYGGGLLTGDRLLSFPHDPTDWVRFRVEAWERPEGVVLRATLWNEGDAEPAQPSLTALDTAPTSLPHGSLALLATGNGYTYFDDLRVEERPSPARSIDRGASLDWRHSGLSADSSYHYWLESYDDGGAASLAAGPIAALPFSTGTPTDDTPPARVGDLAAAAGSGAGEARLTWTAVGDDSLEGRATSYDIRWNLASISEANWGASTRLSTSAPLPSGSGENRLFGGLPQGKTVHFALRSKDEAGNESPLSNDASAALPGDGTPPVLSNIRAQSVGTTNVQIAWSANEPCTGEVRYGRTVSYELGSVSETRLLTTHLLALSGLTAGTVHHYQVRSTDAAGNTTASADYAFTTQTPPPPQDPVISSLTLSSLSDTDAVITFVTNMATIGRIDYGPDAAYGTTVSGTTYATSHTLRLAPLEPGSIYHFRARATSSEGRTATTPDQTLSTSEDTDGPVISEVAVLSVGSSAATIAWQTNEGAVGHVEYGPSDSYGQVFTADTAFVYGHEAALQGLASGILFHFRIRSVDVRGNESVSADFTFATLDSSDQQAPLVSGVRVESVGVKCAYIVWETDEPADAQVEYGTGIPYSHATPLADSLALEHRVSLCGLSAETVYHFRVLSRDGDGNLASSGDALFETAAPPAPPAPAISGVRTHNPTSSGITIAWDTDIAAIGQVEYGTSEAFGVFTAPESTPRREHAVRIEGLSAGILFHYRVLSWQVGGAAATSAGGTFLLTANVDIEPPRVETALAVALSDTSAEIEWSTDEPAEGRLEYGRSTTYDRITPLDTNHATTHVTRIDGLEPLTTYHFRVACSDRSGNAGFSSDHQFTTAGVVDTTAPRIEGLAVQALGASSVRATWSTDETCQVRLAYGVDSSLALSTGWTGAYAVLHQTDVEGLASGTRFYFQALGRDSSGNEGRSPIVSLFLGTETDTVPPAVAGDISSRAGVHDALLLWETGEMSRARIDFGPDTTYGESVEEAGFFVAHAAILTGLRPQTLYHLRLISWDTAGNVGIRAGITVETLPDTLPRAPRIVHRSVATPTSTLAIIEWTTDRPATGQIEYGADGVLNRATALSAVFGTSHRDTLAPLNASTLYSFRIRGFSPEGFFFATAVDTFRTPEDSSPPPPPAFRAPVEVAGGIRLSWEPDPLEEPATVALYRRLLPGGDWEMVWVAAGSETLFVDVLPVDLTGVTKALYYLEAFDAWGNSSVGETIEITISPGGPSPVPAFRVLANRPNPFNPTTTIPFELPSEPLANYHVRIAVYNVAGEEVRVLLDDAFAAGTRAEAVWDGQDYRGNQVASGVYYYRFEAGTYAETRRMTLIR